MKHKHWHRFRSKFRRRVEVPDDFQAMTATHTMRRQLDDVLQHTYGAGWRAPHAEQLHSAIAAQAERVAVNPDDAAAWFALLVLRAPVASRAQEQMDHHPGGFHSKEARVMDLIDFNDAFVGTVLALSDNERSGFVEQMRHEIDRFCVQAGARRFSDEQFEAISRGLSREVAVYLGARRLGYQARMTSRREDALGVDMVVTDPDTGKEVKLDVKSSSSYRYRLQDLVREGRMSETELELGDIHGYAFEVNGHDREAVHVTLMRVDANEVGEIVDFEFVDPVMFEKHFRDVIHASVTQ